MENENITVIKNDNSKDIVLIDEDKRHEKSCYSYKKTIYHQTKDTPKKNFKSKHNKHFNILKNYKQKNSNTSDEHTIEWPQTQCLHKTIIKHAFMSNK